MMQAASIENAAKNRRLGFAQGLLCWVFTLASVGENEPARSCSPWMTTMFLSADHLRLTKDRAFVGNILHLLLHRVEIAEY